MEKVIEQMVIEGYRNEGWVGGRGIARMKTPYVVGPPVRLPDNFFGRTAKPGQFFETLAGAQTHCVSILGLRRAGKTSFLQYISHPEVMASFLPNPRRYLMIYVDVSACKTAAEFYGRVYRKLLSSLPRVPAGIDRARPTADVYESGIAALRVWWSSHRLADG